MSLTLNAFIPQLDAKLDSYKIENMRYIISQKYTDQRIREPESLGCTSCPDQEPSGIMGHKCPSNTRSHTPKRGTRPDIRHLERAAFSFQLWDQRETHGAGLAGALGVEDQDQNALG